MNRIEIEFWNADTNEYEWKEFTTSEFDELNGFEISKKLNLDQIPTLGYEAWDIYNKKNPRLVATFLRRWQAEKFLEHHADTLILIRE